MFGRMTATPLARLDAGKGLEVAVAELLATAEHPQIARWIQFPTALALFHCSCKNPRFRYNEEVTMNPQLQLWMPAVLSLFGTLIVVVLTAWLNTRMLSTQIESVRAQIESVRAELRAEMKQGFAELRLEFHQGLAELTRRIDKLEEARGLVRP